ncbi:OLC1v1010915C1 [Oldenlandia corymbosa var. corymbosa]|uniref:OLC1v1010915C1 n=1 Tax=Oldenlandia corymbosa var. corymbosa TaxID=529605 RepID=A0AAV1DSH5_OLDCO|nr:OLC1v1010915C1 [Oldenlandia corymbosa var. corymbosa]
MPSFAGILLIFLGEVRKKSASPNASNDKIRATSNSHGDPSPQELQDYFYSGLKISKPEKGKNFNLAMEKAEEITDIHNGFKLKWVWKAKKVETRNFYNPAPAGDMNSSLIRSELRKHEKKTIKIHKLESEYIYDPNGTWNVATLDHPATIDTLAMESEVKYMILSDLRRFVQRKEYYRKIGKAWKRGYLLYGPPGTGKSSLIAAIANYLNFDIYDL